MKITKSEKETRIMVDTSIGLLSVLEKGEGKETIVLWPSIFTDHRIYDQIVDTLSQKYRFILIDGPGHGESTSYKCQPSFKEYALAVNTITDLLGVETFHMGGTSWGGMIAVHVALEFPHKVNSLILLNTPFKLGAKYRTHSKRAIAFGARWLLKFAFFRNGIARSFFAKNSLKNNGYLHHFHTMLKNANPKELAPHIKNVLLEHEPLINVIENITVPTLVVCGRYDSMYPVNEQALAVLKIKNARFEIIEGYHISSIDDANSVSSLISSFLGE